MKKYKRGKNEREYIPNRPENYCGTYPIISRSSWEYRMCEWFDNNPSVLEWSSEAHRIPYFDGLKGKGRIYYPDYYVAFDNKKKFIVEVKPQQDLRMPRKKGGKSKKTMMMREITFLTNQAKFKAARAYCKLLGYKFVIITEKDLFRGK